VEIIRSHSGTRWDPRPRYRTGSLSTFIQFFYHARIVLGSVPGSIAIVLDWSRFVFRAVGFLIGGILLDARESTNYFRVFYVRRFFRIVPIYVAVLLIFPGLLFFARVFFHGDYSWLDSKPLPWYSFWIFTQNFWMARTNSSGAMIIAVTWSLAIEEQFSSLFR